MPKFALLLAAGLLIQIQLISAQEEPAAENPHRIAEQSMVLGDIPDSPAAGSGRSSSIWAVVRMILVLALAAAAIYGIVFIFKKSAKKNASGNPFIKILASASVGTNRHVHIVSVGSRAWLLGAADGAVNLISEIEDKEVIDSMMLDDSRKSAETSGRFQDFLSLLRRMGAPAQEREAGADEIRQRRERLKEM